MPVNREVEVEQFLQDTFKGSKASVLDIGCGDGRYTSLFPVAGYLGIDSSIDAVIAAEKSLPGYKFKCISLDEYKPEQVFDYLFSSVMLEQVTDKVVGKIAGWAKVLVLIEPTSLNGWSGSELRHDYLDLFEPYFKQPMSNGATIMLAKGAK